MEKKKTSRDILLSALFRFYLENSKDRPIEYTYGFFDAVGVIRDALDMIKI